MSGKTCIVVDDIADTADTLCQAADKLKARGTVSVDTLWGSCTYDFRAEGFNSSRFIVIVTI